jgi:hypothetical protein
VELTVDGKTYTESLRVEPDPSVPLPLLAAEVEAAENEQAMFDDEEMDEEEAEGHIDPID